MSVLALLLLSSPAFAESWGATNQDLAGNATLIAAYRVSPAGLALDRVYRQTGALPSVRVAVPAGADRLLVVCDDTLCPRAIGVPVEGGWALRALQPGAGAILAPGVVPAGSEADLGGSKPACFVGALPLADGTAPALRVDLPAGEWAGNATLGSWTTPARWGTPAATSDAFSTEVVLSTGSATLLLRGERPTLHAPSGCWTSVGVPLGPPLRSRDDLAWWMQPDATPLLLGEGTLELGAGAEAVRLLSDGHGQILLEIGGVTLSPHGARSAPSGTRWMYRPDTRAIEVLVAYADPRRPRSGAQDLATALRTGPAQLLVFVEDAESASGTLSVRPAG